jgi:putative transposase
VVQDGLVQEANPVWYSYRMQEGSSDVTAEISWSKRDIALLPLLGPDAPYLNWSMDFVMNALATCRRIECLTCVDDFTKECLAITAAFGISGGQVTRVLDSIALFRGYPTTIRTDQGPEFTCRALDQWAFEHGVELRLIQPGKPTQNGFTESFNG